MNNRLKLRANSIGEETIKYLCDFYSTHFEVLRFLESITQELQFSYLIYEISIDNVRSGLVKINLSDEIAEIEIKLIPRFYGQYWEKHILSECEKNLFLQYKKICYIQTKCKVNDIALRYKLEKYGYEKIANDIDKENVTYKKYIDKEKKNDEKKNFNKNKKNILFLTNNWNAISLYEWLVMEEENVYLYSLPLNEKQIVEMDVEIIISYNYVPIIKNNIVKIMKGKIINLHTSYLPWNKGLKPNFWSFISNSKKGVTIHYIDEGIDTGDIILQKELEFDETVETFQSSYDKLNIAIVSLFKKNWSLIREGSLKPYKVLEEGTYNSKKDFEQINSKHPVKWDETISEYKKKIDRG